MDRFFITLGLATFAGVAVISLAMLVDFLIASQRNGKTFPRWVEFWAALTLVFTSVVVGRLEKLTDFWPAVDLGSCQQVWQWVPNTVLFTAMIRLWRVTHFPRHKGDPPWASR